MKDVWMLGVSCQCWCWCTVGMWEEEKEKHPLLFPPPDGGREALAAEGLFIFGPTAQVRVQTGDTKGNFYTYGRIQEIGLCVSRPRSGSAASGLGEGEGIECIYVHIWEDTRKDKRPGLSFRLHRHCCSSKTFLARTYLSRSFLHIFIHSSTLRPTFTEISLHELIAI